jgi:hypothetical protein
LQVAQRIPGIAPGAGDEAGPKDLATRHASVYDHSKNLAWTNFGIAWGTSQKSVIGSKASSSARIRKAFRSGHQFDNLNVQFGMPLPHVNDGLLQIIRGVIGTDHFPVVGDVRGCPGSDSSSSSRARFRIVMRRFSQITLPMGSHGRPYELLFEMSRSSEPEPFATLGSSLTRKGSSPGPTYSEHPSPTPDIEFSFQTTCAPYNAAPCEPRSFLDRQDSIF